MFDHDLNLKCDYPLHIHQKFENRRKNYAKRFQFCYDKMKQTSWVTKFY